MTEGGGDLDLPQESLLQIFVCLQCPGEHLHGFDAVREGIADLVDLTHAAGPKQTQDLIIA
jgi:hypothetical protein